MADFTGTLPAIELAPLLWALPLLPLSGALLGARVARLSGEQDAGGTWLAPASTWLALLASLPLSYRLAGVGGGLRALVAPGPVLSRVGSLDLNLGLTMDATGALFAVVLLLVASLAQLGLLVSPTAGSRASSAAAATAAATAAGAFALLASCPLVASIGAGALTLLGALACGGLGPDAREPAVPGAALLGDALLLAGGAVVTWGMAGSWIGGQLVPSGRPEYVAIVRGEDRGRASQGLPGTVTLTTTPGARILLDNEQKPTAEAPAVRQPVPTGPHTIVVDPGPGSDSIELRKIRIAEGADAALVRASGATETQGAAALLALRDGNTPALLRGKLAEGRWWGVPVATWAGALLVLGALLRLAPPGARRAAGLPLTLLVPQVGGLLVAGLLGARWLGLLGVSAGWPSWVSAGLLVGAGALALVGLRQPEPGRALGFGASASAAVGLAAAAAGSPEAAALQGALAAGASALALWVLAMLERDPTPPWELPSYQGVAPAVEGSVRWLKLSYAALIGLLPVGFGMLETLRSLGATLGLLVLPVVALISASLGRVVYALCEGDGPRWEPPRNVRRGDDNRRRGKDESDPVVEALPGQVAPVLAALVLLLGPLGASTIYNAPLGGWLSSGLSPRGDVPGGSVGIFGVFFLVTGAGLLGARWARGRYGAGRSEAWSEEEPAALAALARAAGRLGQGVEAAGSAAASLDGRLTSLLEGDGPPAP